MLMKKCNSCQNSLNLDQFHKRNKKRKDGSVHVTTQSICKDCSSLRRSQYYKENKNTEVLKRKDRELSIRTWFKEFKKTFKCSSCDDPRWYVIDFHHVNDDKEHNIADLASGKYSKSKILSELSKCVPLCANCHREHHFLERSTS